MKKKIKSGAVLALSACMITTSIPYSGSLVMAANEMLTEFTDELSRGAWEKTSGDGDISFTDGVNENGFMQVHSDGNTIFADTATEKRADGYVEMDITMTKAPNGGRMGIIFRYNSPTDWEGIGIDNGNWTWFNGAGQWGSVTSKNNTFTQVGEKHRIRVEYKGKNVRVLQDGTEIINQDISVFDQSEAGNVGIRLWGLVSQNYDSTFKVDNVKTGDLAAEYTQTFDSEDISNWEAAANRSIYSVIDGKLDMETAPGNESTPPTNAVLFDKNSPDLSTGELNAAFDVKSHAGRFAFIFHYVDVNNYDAVGYDVGTSWKFFHVEDGKVKQETFTGPSMGNGSTGNIKIAFGGTNLKVDVNGDSIYQNENAVMHDSGKMGLRTWGYAGNYAHIAVDTISYNEKEEIEKPDPGEPEEPVEEFVSYTRNFADGTDGFTKVSGTGTMEVEEDEVTIQGDGLFVDENSNVLKNQEVEFTYDPLNNNCNYGVVLRYVSPTDYIYVGPKQQHGQHYTSWGVYGPGGLLAGIEDSGFILEGRVEPYKVKVRVYGNVVTVFVDNEEIYNGEVSGMTDKAGKTGFRTTGNTGMTIQKLTQETAIAPAAVETVKEAVIASEQMTVKMDADFPSVIDYTLKSGNTVKGQEIPVHQLEINNKLYTPEVTTTVADDTMTYHVSVEETGISFDVIFKVEGNVLSMKIQNVNEGDTKLYTLNFPGHSLVSMSGADDGGKLTVNNFREETKINLAKAKASKAYGETTLAVLSNNNVAAAISGDSYKNRHEVAYQTFHVGDHTSTGLWMNEYTYRGLDGEVIEYTNEDGTTSTEPWTKVSVTEDRNGDGKVDYQDGAIALRDDCMKRKTGADTMTDSWNMVAMNVGSEAQYPFLRILDNAKKMSLATDDFGQNIIIKGYQSEGHDASHPDFANYNKRAGGLEDFNTLLENSEDFNTKIGVHVNHTDVYPEAPQFDKLKTSLGAWSWYDSALQIVRENDDLDKSEAGLDGRFAKLYDEDTKNQIDTTYVDVFFGTRWPMYKLVQNINGDDRGMALGTEYVDEMVSYSTFAHHIGSDFGGAGNLVRFVNNNQADVFANHQLFRGALNRHTDDVGINGWQQAKNMNNALQAFYERILPNKYLAQFPVMQYENDNRAVLGEKNEVVTEMVNGVNVIKKDGQEIANGTKIFIPWEKDEDKEGKIYHWNTAGGESTWTLPKSWGNVSDVTIYELSDAGKGKTQTLSVNADRQVTIDAKAKTGYVLYKSEATEIKTAETIEWSTGSPVKDMGFDSHNFDEWKPSSTAETTEHIQIKNNNLGNSHLYIEGENDGKVTQVLTGLVPGQTYSASVWCVTDEGRKASITVENGDKTVTNYMTESNVDYGIHHSDKYRTKAQRMQVRFTAVSDTAKLILSAAKGNEAQSVVDFDDVRVAKVDASTNPQPDKYTYWEDFENTDQGYGVFVSPESDQSHLSQMNPVNPENTPDVIDGTYSLKVRAGNYMRTLPSTVRLEAEQEYTVGLDYKAPAAKAFTFAVKSDKAKAAGDEEHAVIASEVAVDQAGHLELKFTTGNYDDYYIDITRNNSAEYYVDNFYVQAARPINRETLGQLVEEAKALNEKAYTPETYNKMKEAMTEGDRIQKDEKSTAEQIKQAYKALEKAMGELISYATSEEKAELQNVITTMKSLLENDYKQDAQWMTFQTVISEADKLIASDKATSPEVKEMIRELYKAKDALHPVVDRTALKEIMAKAERVDRNTVVDGFELQTFLTAIENAKAVDLKPGVTEEEIKTVTEELTNAYAQILLKEDDKNNLVSEALKKTNVKETYFLEEDWKAITEAKATLTAMRSQTEVKVKDYFATFDKLEAALANKLSRPVLPSSVQIPSEGFTVSANTEQPLTGSEGPVRLAFDKNENTWWHSRYSGGVSETNPAQVTIDMGKEYKVNQFSYLQRAGGGNNGKVQKYNLYVKKNEADEWTKIITNGTFADKAEVQKVKFDAVDARYVMFEVTQGVGTFAAAAELAVYEKASDFSALQHIMNEVDNLDAALYTKASYQTVADLYKDAEALMEDLQTEQKVIDELVKKIEDAITALVEVADSTSVKALENAVKEAEKINTDEYQNVEAFKEALKLAQDVLADVNAGKEVTKDVVTEAALNLLEEQSKLQPVENKMYLSALIEYAQAQKSNEDYKYVIPVVKAAFEKALSEAIAVNEKADAASAEIEKAYDNLLSMVHYLTFTGNSESLKVLADAAHGLNEKLYTEETWAVLVDALVKADAILADENALQAEIDVAREVLQAAMDALVKNPVDKSKLAKLAEKAKKYEAAIVDYTPATAEIFKGALAHARDILAKDDVTQEEIDAAYGALQNAIFGLRLTPDKGKLEDLIKDADKVDITNYTAESVAAFTAALDNAKAVFADANATEEDVKAAEKALKKAQKNLVVKADGNSNAGDKAAKTGDAVQTTATLLAMLMAGLTAIFSFRKRKDK